MTLAVFPLTDVIRAENRAISCRESVEEEICMGSPSAKTPSPRTPRARFEMGHTRSLGIVGTVLVSAVV